MPDSGPGLGLCLELLLGVDVELRGAGGAWWWWWWWLADPLALLCRVVEGVVHPAVDAVRGFLLRLVCDQLFDGGDGLLWCVAVPGRGVAGLSFCVV